MKLALFPLMQSSILALAYLYTTSDLANAQVTSDGTVNTQVNQTDNVSEITGGETRGDNLFHSFQEFSVRTGNEAFFNNAAAIKNIFSRVTGGNASTIDGLIRANGSASLFLINPAGIIFGEGARLDIGGSFYGSSASSILFDDGEFSATDTQAQPILTINAPIGLGFRDNPGDIVNRSNFGLRETVFDENFNSALAGRPFTLQNSIGLGVNPNQSVNLVGGNVILENAAGITAPGGRVELGGLSQAGVITFNDDGSLTFPEGIARGDVALTEQSRVSVAASGGGFVNINANNLSLSEGSELFAGIAENMGSSEAQAGNININAIKSVKLIGNGVDIEGLDTVISNHVGRTASRRNNPDDQSNALGNGGLININTGSLELENRGVISTITFNKGDAGSVNIQADNIVLNTLGEIASRVRQEAEGNAGNVNINTNSFSVNNGFILANSSGKGNAGNVSIEAQNIDFAGGLDNGLALILTQIESTGEGQAGDININTGNLILRNNSQLITDNQGQGDAGNITINASNSVALKGRESLILSQVQTNVVGDGGDVTIIAPSISLDNFSLISANAKRNSLGNAGNIYLNADTVRIDQGSIIDSLSENNSVGGNITINANTLELVRGGKLVTANDAGGNAGDINLNLTKNLIVDNISPPENSPFSEQILQNLTLKTGLFANTASEATGNAGGIDIQADLIRLENGGSIFASTTSGEGGNININSNFIVAFPDQNNDIIANAIKGRGGNISITADSVFGIEERPESNLTNDIDASSELNLDGTVSIKILEPDAIRGTTELPRNVIQPKETTEQACSVNPETGKTNGLTVKSKGGVPPAPDLPLNSQAIMVNGQDTTTQTDQAQYPEIKPIPTSYGDIIPAQGVIVTEDGRVILTAYRTDGNSRVPRGSANCGK